MSRIPTSDLTVDEGPPVVRLSRRRQAIGRRMRESVTTKPPVTLHTTAAADVLVAEVDASRISGPRRISLLGALAGRVVAVLARHPDLNGHLLEAGIRRFAEVNLGIAVDVPQGLVVPVIHDAGRRTAAELSEQISELAQAARAGSLRPDQMLDGTFTISNLGSLGIEQFTPIINPPELAILGIGRLRDVPVWRDGQWDRQSVVHLSLTFDHAAVDGAPAARFLDDLSEAIENPALSLPASATPDEEIS